MSDFIDNNNNIPIINIEALINKNDNNIEEYNKVIKEIGNACRYIGFFYIINHHIDENIINKLLKVSKLFFSQDISEKDKINMKYGGKAWRGFFKIGYLFNLYNL